jgi:hypothetical protein
MKNVIGLIKQSRIIRATHIHYELGEVKQSLHRPRGFQEVEAHRIFRISAHKGGKVVSPVHRLSLLTRENTWYSFLLETKLTPRPGIHFC